MGINGNEVHHQSSTDQRAQSDDTSLHQEIDFPTTQPRWSNSSRYVYVFIISILLLYMHVLHTQLIRIHEFPFPQFM